MRVIATDTLGNPVQFEADAQTIEADVSTLVNNANTVSGAASGAISSLKVDVGVKTATAVAGAATLAKTSGVITSEALTTAAGALYTLTLTDAKIAATDIVMASVQLTSAGGTPAVASVTPAAGSVVIVIQNIHASAAFAAAIKIAFVVFKA